MSGFREDFEILIMLLVTLQGRKLSELWTRLCNCALLHLFGIILVEFVIEIGSDGRYRKKVGHFYSEGTQDTP